MTFILFRNLARLFSLLFDWTLLFFHLSISIQIEILFKVLESSLGLNPTANAYDETVTEPPIKD